MSIRNRVKTRPFLNQIALKSTDSVNKSPFFDSLSLKTGGIKYKDAPLRRGFSMPHLEVKRPFCFRAQKNGGEPKPAPNLGHS